MIRGIQIEYKGCFFHSLLELKFALLIEDSCSFLREPISIFYDKETLQPVSYIDTNPNKYTPDFLVRKWKDNTAYLIEIKADKFRDSDDLNKRKIIANNYLKSKNVDWTYKVIFDSDIKLNEEKAEKFKELRLKAGKFKQKLDFMKKDKRYNQSDQLYFSCSPRILNRDVTKNEYVKYVKYGTID